MDSLLAFRAFDQSLAQGMGGSQAFRNLRVSLVPDLTYPHFVDPKLPS